MYRQLPFMVVHMTTDGTVLHANPETYRTTGYGEAELLGKNFWAVLFPGKLFAQVPRFISLLQPSPLLKDVPMTIRTSAGHERVLAFSRYLHGGAASGANAGPRTFICVAVDITDRLLDAERSQLPEISAADFSEFDGIEKGGVLPFGPASGAGGTMENDLVTPLAITPRAPKPTGDAASPIEQARDSLARAEMHMSCVQSTFSESELHTLTAMVDALENQAEFAYAYVAASDDLASRVSLPQLRALRARVEEMLNLYQPDIR